MAIYMYVVVFLVLVSVAYCQTDSCGFKGQCRYNLKVHHCKPPTRKRSTDTSATDIFKDDCLCLDLERAKNQLLAMKKWAADTKIKLQNLMKEFNSTKKELDQKTAELHSVQSIAEQRNKSILLSESERSKIEKQVLDQNLNWVKEKARLQQELQKVNNASVSCKAAQSSGQQITTTDATSRSITHACTNGRRSGEYL